MDEKIEKEVELCKSLHSFDEQIFHCHGVAELGLRRRGARTYKYHMFERQSNVEVYNNYLNALDKVSMFDINSRKGQFNRSQDPKGSVQAEEVYFQYRFEMYKRGMTDCVFDKWGIDNDEIAKRVKENKCVPIKWKCKEEIETNENKAYNIYTRLLWDIDSIKKLLDLDKKTNIQTVLEKCESLKGIDWENMEYNVRHIV